MIASVNEASSGPMITHLSGFCESINPLIHTVMLLDLIPVVAEKAGLQTSSTEFVAGGSIR